MTAMKVYILLALLASTFSCSATLKHEEVHEDCVSIQAEEETHQNSENQNYGDDYTSDNPARHETDVQDSSDDLSIVNTTLGRVRSQTETVVLKGGRSVTVDVYWAIPFAKSPVGDLRFRPPVPASPWSDVLKAKGPPNACVQVLDKDPPLVPNPESPLSEDCLYVTIWRPRCGDISLKNGTSFVDHTVATMVFVFGGGYTTGSSTTSIYHGSHLAATQCVIIASMNYRLGPLGLLFLDIPDAPGNMALLDTALALKWVKDNVKSFGGDPDNITLVGFSAGGTTASLFLMSPLTHNLFKRVIIQSGSPTNHLAVQSRDSALTAARNFSKAVGCLSTDHAEIVECLRKIDAVTLVNKHSALAQAGGYQMVATVDNFLVNKNPLDVLRSGDFFKCDLLLGSLLDEGTLFMRRFWPHTYDFHLEQPRTFTEQELDSKLSTFFSGFLKADFIAKTLSDVKDVYQYSEMWDSGDAHRILLNKVITDVLFTCQVRLMAGAYARSSQNVYLYSFNHAHDWTDRPWWVGAMHGSDVDFVFGKASIDTSRFSQREARLSETMMAYWGNFIKYGNPSPKDFDGIKWPTYHSPDPGSYLQFTPSADIIVDKTEDRRCVYWSNLSRDYFKN